MCLQLTVITREELGRGGVGQRGFFLAEVLFETRELLDDRAGSDAFLVISGQN